MESLKIAFRNIFRNSRRSMLTLTIITLGIALAILGLGWFGGILNSVTEEAVKGSGNIRITATDFELKEKSFDTSSNIDYEEVKDKVAGVKETEKVTGVIKFGATVFKKEDEQKPAMGFGVESNSYEINKFGEAIIEGRFLNFNNKNEIIIGEKLKRFLGLKLGEKITILSKTQNSSIAAHNYKIVGVYSMENGKMNQSFYLTLNDAQYLLDMEGVVTEFQIFTEKSADMKKVKKEVMEKLGKNFLVKSWNEIGVASMIASVLPFVQKVVVAILALLAGIGIANTMIMVVFERKREIGVMKSMGVSNSGVGIILLFEGVFIGVIGSIAGAVLGGVISFILSKTGVALGKALDGMPSGLTIKSTIYPEFNINYVVAAFIAGTAVAFLATLLPVCKIAWKEPAELLKD